MTSPIEVTEGVCLGSGCVAFCDYDTDLKLKNIDEMSPTEEAEYRMELRLKFDQCLGQAGCVFVSVDKKETA